MNMILCSQSCRHQQDGYCGLNHIGRLTNSTSDDVNKCGYFESMRKNTEKKPKKLAENAKSL